MVLSLPSKTVVKARHLAKSGEEDAHPIRRKVMAMVEKGYLLEERSENLNNRKGVETGRSLLQEAEEALLETSVSLQDNQTNLTGWNSLEGPTDYSIALLNIFQASHSYFFNK